MHERHVQKVRERPPRQDNDGHRRLVIVGEGEVVDAVRDGRHHLQKRGRLGTETGMHQYWMAFQKRALRLGSGLWVRASVLEMQRSHQAEMPGLAHKYVL